MAQPARKYGTFNESYIRDRRLSFSTFHLFPRLPPELQLRIWKLAIRRNRLISIQLSHVRSGDRHGKDSPRYQSKNSLGNIISGIHYRWTTETRGRPNALFRACHDARRAALQHYRILLPAHPKYKSKKQLYINPEYDFLKIEMTGEDGLLLVDFLNDVKAYDPKRVGVLQLAMEQKQFLQLNSVTMNSIITPAIESFKETLRNLRHVWATVLFSGRVNLGILEGRRPYRMGMNRSLPIFSTAPYFEWLESDPRPIEPDLAETGFSQHPGLMKEAWERLETRFLGDRNCETPMQRKFSYVMAEHYKYLPRVNDRETMSEVLRHEDKTWAYWDEKLGLAGFGNTEERRRELLSVAGLWVFDENTFRNVRNDRDGRVIKDLKGCKPGLVVTRFKEPKQG